MMSNYEIISSMIQVEKDERLRLKFHSFIFGYCRTYIDSLDSDALESMRTALIVFKVEHHKLTGGEISKPEYKPKSITELMAMYYEGMLQGDIRTYLPNMRRVKRTAQEQAELNKILKALGGK